MLASAAVTAAWFAIPLACDSPYTYGDCEVTDDCYKGAQTIPGTFCHNDLCRCQDLTHEICCDYREADDPKCKLACRPCYQCAEGTEQCEGRVYECRSPEDCPAAATICPNTRSCDLGRCGHLFVSGDATSQKRGDCVRLACDSAGMVTVIVDYGDVHDDGNDCTLDQCDEAGPFHTVRPDGTRCASGYCVDGGCVECMRQSDCEDLPNAVCDAHKCVPASCIDSRLGSDEADTDCGGPCVPCANGAKCAIDADCSSGACKVGRCVAATASDGRANGSETGTDCGGPDAPACRDGERCAYDSDCTSRVCFAGVCRAPTCTDGTQNGSETGTDCGGPCDVACE
jgi:hypothetical protein